MALDLSERVLTMPKPKTFGEQLALALGPSTATPTPTEYQSIEQLPDEEIDYAFGILETGGHYREIRGPASRFSVREIIREAERRYALKPEAW